MNVQRAILESIPQSRDDLIEERSKLVLRIFHINEELAVLDTLLNLGADSPTQGE